ncbi:MAG TPA: class I SAM-dependent methyltransferase [Bacteroidia bacterium]|nr:class I SAM-dependent methyltransferase [Bacteroidia bacterium]
MEAQLEEIREQQRASWNKFSPGWKKWDEMMMEFMKPVADEIINTLNLKNDHVVLDIAGGTGEPGLSIATKLTNGKVLITDLAEDMLAITKEHAAKKGIKNIETKVCDVSELPFDDNSFDAISCRFGYMFFPDMNLATREMARVLKPGGKLATAVWNVAEKNFWVTAIGGTINKNMQLAPPPPEAPGMFRCAAPGLMQSIFQNAGLKNVMVKEIPVKLSCGTTDVYWNMMTDVAAPFVAALSKADEAMKAKIKKEVYDIIQQKYPEGKVNIDASTLVISGQK